MFVTPCRFQNLKLPPPPRKDYIRPWWRRWCGWKRAYIPLNPYNTYGTFTCFGTTVPLSEPENRKPPSTGKTISAPNGIVGTIEEGLQQVVACVTRQQQAGVLTIKDFIFYWILNDYIPGVDYFVSNSCLHVTFSKIVFTSLNAGPFLETLWSPYWPEKIQNKSSTVSILGWFIFLAW